MSIRWPAALGRLELLGWSLVFTCDWQIKFWPVGCLGCWVSCVLFLWLSYCAWSWAGCCLLSTWWCWPCFPGIWECRKDAVRVASSSFPWCSIGHWTGFTLVSPQRKVIWVWAANCKHAWGSRRDVGSWFGLWTHEYSSRSQKACSLAVNFWSTFAENGFGFTPRLFLTVFSSFLNRNQP